MSVNNDEVINGLQQYVSTRFAPQAIRETAVRIGLLLKANMQLANRSVLRIRSGRLIGSLQYRIKQTPKGAVEIEAGSFGVPYAAIHEFGYEGVMNIRSHTRRGRPVRAHARMVNIPARPYVGPAFERSKVRIIDLLRASIK